MRPAPLPPIARVAAAEPVSSSGDNPFESHEYEASHASASRPSTRGLGSPTSSSASTTSLPVPPDAAVVAPLAIRGHRQPPPRPARSTDLGITPAPDPNATQPEASSGEVLNEKTSHFDTDSETSPPAHHGTTTTKDKVEPDGSQQQQQPGGHNGEGEMDKKKKKPGMFKRTYLWARETYKPIEEAPLVLPTAPTDEEKLSYLHTNRVPLYIFGIISFLSLAAGMWLFALCAPPFYFYGGFVGFLNIYLLVSYFVGVVGRDWDHEAHKRRAAAHPLGGGAASAAGDDDPGAGFPTVDVYLPVCAEQPEILANTWAHVARLDWPASRLRVHVLDDGASGAVRELAARHGFAYVVRGDRPRLKKAGNLRWAFARTSGEYFLILDADFCPRPDLLRELAVWHLADPAVAIVQSPQFFRVSGAQTWVEQGAGATQELFYRVVQVNRDRWGASICVGSNALYRRSALEEVGGTADIGFSEDVHTGFGAVDRGWKVRYVPLCLATGVCPPTPRSFFSQQMRWARGSTTLLTNGHFWVSNLSLIQKVCYLCGFLYYSAVSIGIFVSPVPGILLLWIRPEWFKAWNLAFAVPSLAYGLVVFRVWAKAAYGMNVQHVMLIQSYAYLTAIKDRLLGIELMWAASGDAAAHRSHKYRNMRLLCWAWTGLVFGGMASAVGYRIATGFPWYHTLPLVLLNAYNLYVSHRFLLCNW